MKQRKPTELLVDYSLHIAIIILAIVCAIHKPLFIKNAPLDLIKRTAAYVIMALAMGCVLRVGEIDLSQGRILGITAIIAALFLVHRSTLNFNMPNINPFLLIALVALACLIVGALIGFINGWITAKLRVPSWLATLAMQLILYGLMLILLTSPLNHMGSNVPNLMPEYKNLVTHTVKIGGWAIPNYVWFAIGLTVIIGLLWHFTKFGKKMKAVGENRAAAGAAGINVNWTIILAFVIAGVLCAFNGIIEAARVGGPGASAGANAELDAVTACLIGGFSLRGGRGNVLGLIVGVAFLLLSSIALQWFAVPANPYYIIKGVQLLIAAALSINRDLRGTRKPEEFSTAPEGDESYDTQETA